MSFITVDPKYPVYDGIPLTFRAPCDSKDAEGLLVANTKYYFRDANSDDVTGINRLFSAGAYVSVTLDTTKKYAYITNAVTNYSNTVAGDILETVRTDLGDRWLLCNGNLVRDGQYPKLREVMPYNTEWRRVAPFQDFDRVQAIYGKPGQWALIKSWNPGSSGSQGKAAALYDANTDEVTAIGCPVVQTERAYGIIGLSHDGDRYILGVGERSDASDLYYRCHLFASDDLVNWTKARSFDTGTYHEPYDMIFDGTGTIVASQYYPYTGNTDETYRVNVHYTNKEMTQTTQMSLSWRPEYLSYLAICPGGWFFTRYDSEYVSARESGSSGSSLFDFSENGKVAFFSEKYFVGLPSKGKSTRYIEIYNIETKKSSDIYAENLFVGGNGHVWLCGGEYNKNTNEWELYFRFEQSSSLGTVPTGYYIAYISADADPSDVTQYRIVRVEALPDTMGNEQMASDRSRLTSDGMLRDPNQKYLPKHSGDTLKYIYTG